MKAKSPPPIDLPKRFSLVAQTACSLREGIRAGQWRAYLPGERELCAQLQVGRNTLRAALRELERGGLLKVASRRRRRIRATRAAREPGAAEKKIAVLSARSLLALPPSMVIVVDTLRDQLTKAGCLVELHVNRACFSAKPARALDDLVQRHPARTWLVLSSSEPMQRCFIRRQWPCLVVGSCASHIALPSVDADYRATCRHAGGLLLHQGHRRIALVRPAGGSGGDIESELGLREALRDRPDALLRILTHDGTTAHLCALLDATMRSSHPPTAYLVLRTAHVLTVMMHLMRRGQRIPQDVAVIARDDDPVLQATTPTVTRYAINPAQFARRVSMAARQLAETGILPPRPLRLMSTFIPGETA